MKAESNLQPKNKFEIENIIDGKCEIVFYDNIQKLESLENETRYSYDIYRLKVNYRDDLEKDLNDNEEKFIKWLELAKKTEISNLAKEIRNKRDELLKETDWTQMEDTALTKENQEIYKEYRQKLRDIPEQSLFPYQVEFPAIPKLEEKEV
ncbi:MAG: tail fiber assembly protein [Clostridia bacterium]